MWRLYTEIHGTDVTGKIQVITGKKEKNIEKRRRMLYPILNMRGHMG